MSAVSAAAQQPITFVLFRHGETLRNVNGTIQGRDENPETQLTQKGEGQAKQMGTLLAEQFPDITVFYAPPSQRCTKTAQIVAECFASKYSAKKFPLHESNGLIGINHADTDGMKYTTRNLVCDELYKLFATRSPQLAKDPLYKWKHNPFTNAETVYSVWERTMMVLIAIAQSHAKNPTTIAIASTTVPMASLRTMSQHVFSKSTPIPVPLFFELDAKEKLANCSVLCFKYNPNETVFERKIEFIKAVNLDSNQAQAKK